MHTRTTAPSRLPVKSVTLFVVVVVMVAAALLLAPIPLAAQADDAAQVDAAEPITGTVQIVADDARAIRALLEEPAIIPGGFGGYPAAIFWTMVFGALGGMVFELLRLRGYLALPHRYRPGALPDNDAFLVDGFLKPYSAVDLGVFARMFVGAMAALAILLVVSPPERMKLIAAAVIAGSAGASIFDTLRARLTASLAVADASDLRNKSEELEARLDEMAELIAALQAQGRGVLPSSLRPQQDVGSGEEKPTPQQAPIPAVTVDPTTLDQLSRVLGEAKGIRASMERRRPAHVQPDEPSDGA